MTPGPFYIHPCPQCKTNVLRGSLSSGNNFGAIVYSNGNTIAPMLPTFPLVTECRNCHTIFWLHIENHIARISFYDESPLTDNIPMAQSLSADAIKRTLTAKNSCTAEEELYLRLKYWRMINNRLYINNGQADNQEQIIFWEENIRHLITIMEQSNSEDDWEILAELYRNLGDFSQCHKMLDRLKQPYHVPFVQQLRLECEKGNHLRVKLRL